MHGELQYVKSRQVITGVNIQMHTHDGSKRNLPIDMSLFSQTSLWVQAQLPPSYSSHISATGCHIYISAGKVACGCMLAWGKVKQDDVNMNIWKSCFNLRQLILPSAEKGVLILLLVGLW